MILLGVGVIISLFLISRAQPSHYSVTKIEPILVHEPSLETTQLTLQMVDEFRWRVKRYNPAKGVIEASMTSFWFNDKNDVVIKIVRQSNDSSLVDVEPASVKDQNVDISQIQFFLEQLQNRIE